MAENQSIRPHGNDPSADVHLERLLASELGEPWYRSIFNNIRELLHPAKLPPLELTSKPLTQFSSNPLDEHVHFQQLIAAEIEEPWYRSIYKNIKELIHPPKLPPLELTSKPLTSHSADASDPDVHLQRFLPAEIELPWYRSALANLKELIHPTKLPPLELTSKPVMVKDIWGFYGDKKRQAGVSSVLIHVAVVTLLFTVASNRTVQSKVRQTVALIAPDIAPWIPQAAPKPQTMGGGGGGGDRSPLPASKGRLPKVSPRQFTPPMVVVNNPNPKLIMEPTIVAPPDVQLPQVNMAQYGDPLGRIGPPSNGPGSGGGIGSGSGGGVGSGEGAGFGPGRGGGVGGGAYRIGGGVSAPVPLYKPEPEYSEEARKAKFQGTVVIYIEVDEKGIPRNLRVVRALGLGLDEKALEAVNKWRFKPGLKDGKPVTVAAQVEVNFRLL